MDLETRVTNLENSVSALIGLAPFLQLNDFNWSSRMTTVGFSREGEDDAQDLDAHPYAIYSITAASEVPRGGILGMTDGTLAGVAGLSMGCGVRGQGIVGVFGTDRKWNDSQDPYARDRSLLDGTSGTGVLGKATVFGVLGETTGVGEAIDGGDTARAGVYGRNATSTTAPGVMGTNVYNAGPGVHGSGDTGVFGESSKTNHAGAAGWHRGHDGFGLIGAGDTGVLGMSTRTNYAGVAGWHHGDGFGVLGSGSTGVFGTSSTTGHAGVTGWHQGEGFGLVGFTGEGVDTAGVLGVHAARPGTGVRGEGSTGVVGRSTSDLGIGVSGIGAYGGHFAGVTAQVRLLPADTVGRPQSGFHHQGELFMDSSADLFACVAEGSPGDWVRLVTEPA